MACQLISKCNLPVQFGREVVVEMTVFSCGNHREEVVSLVHKQENHHPSSIPVVRVHSACITSEIFGSQKCDCSYQFKKGMEKICSAPYGIMLYMLTHEGRGIGLSNKIRAYDLQDKGANTIEANKILGLEVDDRDFSPAVEVLKYFKITKAKLITNNPDKIFAMEKGGIEVTEQINLDAQVNRFNENYLLIKKNCLNHKFKGFLYNLTQIN